MINRRSLLIGLCLAGCSSPDPRLYTLAMKPGTIYPALALTIVVRSPIVPRYLERREIIRRDADERMKAPENDWWSEPLRDMVGRVLVADLAQRLPATQVLGSEGLSADLATAEIEIELQRFDSDGAGLAVLSGFVGIDVKGQSRRLEKLHAEMASTGTTIGAHVDALSAVLGRAADDIAASLPR